MNSRLDHDQDNAVITQIKGLQSDVEELKSRQSIGRELVARSYSIQTAASFDVSAYSVPANSTHFIYFFLTCDTSQTYPYGVQYCQVYNNGTDAAHRLSDYEINDSTGVNYKWAFNTGYRNVNAISWYLSIVNTGSSAASIYVKFRAIVSAPAVSLGYSLV